MTKTFFMAQALDQARQAAERGEIPVGCVIEKNGQIIARAGNRREELNSALGHAEIAAISEACSALGDWRLEDCSIYVTLEPCPMCAGAIMNARIPRVYYGATDTTMGACGGVMNIFEEAFGFHPLIEKGILEKECSEVLKDFFRQMRR